MRSVGQLIHNFFVPSEGNNLRARGLHNDFLTFYLVIALLMVISVKTFKTQINNVLGYATDISVQRLYDLTNVERQNNGLSALVYNENLSRAAYLKAQDMFAENYWDHFSPSGKSPWNFILAANYKYKYAGENLAKNFLFSQDVVNAWMASPSHRENIVRGEFQDVGYAVVNGVLNGEETTLVVQMFGSPQSTTIANVPAVQAEEPQTQKPTAAPKPTAQPTEAPVKVEKTNEQIIVAPAKKDLSKLSINFSYVFIGFILLVLFVDLYFANKFNIVRMTSKNLAHIVFLITIITGVVIFLTKGSII